MGPDTRSLPPSIPPHLRWDRGQGARGTILLRVLSQAVQGAGAGLDSGLYGLKLMPRTLSRGFRGRALKMLLTGAAWRLGGTLLGDAVVCKQRRLLLAATVAHRRVPAAAAPSLWQP